ncbi:MAG: TetR/AcrR family transcriptional regulator [Gammaproteobacteria bacterium]
MAAEVTPIRRIAAKAAAALPASASEGARGAVLDAALHLFAERGYAGASIRDIATASGIQPATIYSHFPSKEHVLAELVRIGHEEHFRRVSAALLESQPDPAHQIVAFVGAHVRMHTDLSMLAVVANAELHFLTQETGARAFQLREQSEEMLTRIIQRGMDRGVFQVPDCWFATAAIGGMGLRVAYWYSPDAGVDVERLVGTYAEFALRILGVPDDHPQRPHPSPPR